MSELRDKERRFVEDQRRVENFLGHEHRNCGEHRTVGPHRAWCYDCEEWCYPDAPCIRCEEPRKDALLAEAAEVLRELAVDETAVPDEMIRWYEDRAKPLLDKLEER